MKIAQLAPCWLSCPPKKYGGTEAVVHSLTEELVKRGHDVTLFATGDSKTNAKLDYFYKKPLGNVADLKTNPYLVLPHYYHCFKQANKFDLIHNHNDEFAYLFTDLIKTPVVHTLHGSFYEKEVKKEKKEMLKDFYYQNFISISKSQQKSLKDIKFMANIYNGVNLKDFKFEAKRGDYLFWIGRITYKKGASDAIKVAKNLGMRLVIAGSIDPAERDYLEREVLSQVDGEKIIFAGEVGLKRKAELFRNAACSIFPIHWHEPFGLVMAESMACGTPVVAYDKGAAREVVRNNLTGFVVPPKKGIEGLSEAVEKSVTIDRPVCREHVKESFTVEKMTDKYERIYKKLLGLDLYDFSYLKYN